MGKVTGFLEYPRNVASCRPVQERLLDYKEVTRCLPVDELQLQGARCMDCGIPFCHAMGCPLYNLIPEWNDAVYKGHWREAYERLELTNMLPEITGRICPAPCETSCTLSINAAPVTIKQIEYAVIERAWAEGWVESHPPKKETGKRAAVIGSGPAGLVAAQMLRRCGHSVTLFEKSDKIGGILRYGIPDFKLEKWVIDRRIKQMRQEGITFETGVSVGEDISTRYIQQKFDAVVMTLGSSQPRDLNVPGRELDGIHFAMTYLTQSNKHVNDGAQKENIVWAEGKHVLVIGGGDTGSDCVGTANRQGAASVKQFEIMPKPTEWKEPRNPNWPYWPNILRTSSSHEEGCERDWLINTKEFIGKNGSLKEVVCCRVEWKQTGKGMAPQEVPGSEFRVKADLVLLAMGFVHVEHSKLLSDFDIAFDERGNIKTTNYQTSRPNIFAAGDADTGASLVVRALFHGREAALKVDQYLRGL